MERIRWHHSKTREQLKQILLELLQEHQIETPVNWNGFEFEGKAYGTTIQGEIFEQELYIEISGWFEGKATQKLRDGWKDLVQAGIV